MAALDGVKVGDKFRMRGVFLQNPKWRWWKFWQPKHTEQSAEFTVVHIAGGRGENRDAA